MGRGLGFSPSSATDPLLTSMVKLPNFKNSNQFNQRESSQTKRGSVVLGIDRGAGYLGSLVGHLLSRRLGLVNGESLTAKIRLVFTECNLEP